MLLVALSAVVFDADAIHRGRFFSWAARGLVGAGLRLVAMLLVALSAVVFDQGALLGRSRLIGWAARGLVRASLRIGADRVLVVVLVIIVIILVAVCGDLGRFDRFGCRAAGLLLTDGLTFFAGAGSFAALALALLFALAGVRLATAIGTRLVLRVERSRHDCECAECGT